jgi:hypothetical protein
MGGTCRSEGRNNKFMVGYTGKPYANGTGKKGNIKSSNTLKYQSIRQSYRTKQSSVEIRFCRWRWPH